MAARSSSVGSKVPRPGNSSFTASLPPRLRRRAAGRSDLSRDPRRARSRGRKLRVSRLRDGLPAEPAGKRRVRPRGARPGPRRRTGTTTHRPATTEIEQPPLDERACLEVSVQAVLPNSGAGAVRADRGQARLRLRRVRPCARPADPRRRGGPVPCGRAVRAGRERLRTDARHVRPRRRPAAAGRDGVSRRGAHVDPPARHRPRLRGPEPGAACVLRAREGSIRFRPAPASAAGRFPRSTISASACTP